MTDRLPREGARWSRPEPTPEPPPKAATPLPVDEDRELREKLIVVYGAENYDKALSVYTKLEYAYPGWPLTSLRPVQFAKELLDEGNRNIQFARTWGENWTIDEFLTFCDNNPDKLSGHVNNKSLLNQIVFGNKKVAKLRSLIHKLNSGDLSALEQFTWFSLTKGSVFLWVFGFPFLMAFLGKIASIIWKNNLPYKINSINILLLVYVFFAVILIEIIESSETKAVTWASFCIYCISIVVLNL